MKFDLNWVNAWHIGYRAFGIKKEDWGWRLMFWWWHLCWHHIAKEQVVAGESLPSYPHESPCSCEECKQVHKLRKAAIG